MWDEYGNYIANPQSMGTSSNFMQGLLSLNGSTPYGAFAPQAGVDYQGLADGFNPQAGGMNWLSKAQGIGTLLQGIAQLGSLWGGLQSLKQAKREFKFNKKLTSQNYANQAKLTNMQLSDLYRGRNRNETDADVAAYMALSGIQETL